MNVRTRDSCLLSNQNAILLRKQDGHGGNNFQKCLVVLFQGLFPMDDCAEIWQVVSTLENVHQSITGSACIDTMVVHLQSLHPSITTSCHRF